MPQKPPRRYTPSFPTFYKPFKGAIVPCEGEIEVSEYFLAGLRPLLASVIHSVESEISDSSEIKNFYVVAPQYTDVRNGKIVDCQLTITGSSQFSEFSKISGFREIYEETGIAPKNITKSVHRFNGHERHINNFWCKIDSKTPLFPQTIPAAAAGTGSEFVTPDVEAISEPKETVAAATVATTATGAITTSCSPQDDKRYKIQILMFGRLSELETLFSGTLFPLPSKDTDPTQNKKFYISGLRLISLADAKYFLDRKQDVQSATTSVGTAD